MQDVNFKKSVYAALILILLECFLLMNKSYSQKLPGTTNNDEQTGTISKVIGSTEIQKAIKRCKGKSVFISFFPVKSNNYRKTEFELQVVYQCEGERNIPRGQVVDLKSFKMKTTAYIKYLKKMKVAKEKVPYCYYIQITADEAKNLAGVAVSINPELGDFKASNIYPCDSLQNTYRNKNNDECDCKNTAFYFMSSAIPPGRCPPGTCPTTKVAPMNKIVEGTISEVYGNQ